MKISKRERNTYDIFISYRRSGGAEYARMLYLELKARGYRCFFDYNSLRSGKFNEKIYEAIEQCSYFFLVLTDGALDRCQSPDDWVRHEIECALRNNKTVVPVAPSGARRSFPAVLPETLECIRNIQVSKLDVDDLFEKSIDKIIEDRLDPSLNPVLKRRRMRRIILMGMLAVASAIVAWVWPRGHEARKAEEGGGTNTTVEAARLVVRAKIGGADVECARICGCSGASDDLNEPVQLPRGKKCGPLFVTAQKDGKEYSAVIERFEVDWMGSREIGVELLKDPEPGTCIALPLTNGVPIYMVWCPKGEFAVNVYDREDEKDGLRTAEVGHGFWISKYEYTQEQDDALWGRPVQDRERAFYPRDFYDFKRELKTWKKLERLGLRMPHIGEWCRACQYGGWNPTVSNVIDYACIGAVSMGRPNPTGVLKPNKLGLYDIYGNASERVWGLAELCVGLPNPMPKFVDDNESHTVGGDCHSHPFQLAMFLFDVEMIVKQEFSTIRPVADRIPKWREFVVENGEDRQAYGKPPKSTFLRNEKWSADQKENYRRKMLKDENAQKPILEYWGKIVL